MGNGQWAMGNGQWAMGNGQWAMKREGFKVRKPFTIHRSPLTSVFKYIPNEVVVLVKGGKVVVATFLYADQRNFLWVYLLKGYTVPDGYKPVFGTMKDIGMALHFW